MQPPDERRMEKNPEEKLRGGGGAAKNEKINTGPRNNLEHVSAVYPSECFMAQYYTKV